MLNENEFYVLSVGFGIYGQAENGGAAQGCAAHFSKFAHAHRTHISKKIFSHTHNARTKTLAHAHFRTHTHNFSNFFSNE